MKYLHQFDNDRISAHIFVLELSELIAIYQFREWEEAGTENLMCRVVDIAAEVNQKAMCKLDIEWVRLIAAAGFMKSGNSAAGYPGILPQLIRMIQSKEISIFSIATNTRPIDPNDIKKSLDKWYFLESDANKALEQIIPESLKEKIKYKLNAGRYTLMDAASHIAEDQLRLPMDIVAILKEAALQRKFKVFHPGKNNVYDYNQTTKTPNAYYEEVRWDDLNTWLQTAFPQCVSFPQPSAEKKQDGISPGLPKSEITALDWPLPDMAPPLINILNEIPDWVAKACTRVGRPGAGRDGSHLWNPAMLAICLASEAPRKKWTANSQQLGNFLKKNYPDFAGEWAMKMEIGF
jgi:hypothetical protein